MKRLFSFAILAVALLLPLSASAANTTGSLTTTGSVTLTKPQTDTLAQVQISGTYGTVSFVFEGTFDGTNWNALAAVDMSLGSIVTGTISPSDNATNLYDLDVAGLTGVRLRATAVGSGTLAVASQSGAYVGIPSIRSQSATTFGASTFTGAVTAQSSVKSTSATAGVGYGTGAGGSVTQASSRTTGVTLNTATGAITLVSAAGSGTAFTFTVTDSAVAATDVVIVSVKSSTDTYSAVVTAVAAGSFKITVTDLTGTTTEQPVINFAVIKGVSS